LPAASEHDLTRSPAREAKAREKRIIMNEFQAILTVITFFAFRFALPAVVIYTSARLVGRYFGLEGDIQDPVTA
jgi:hypothetical protein